MTLGFSNTNKPRIHIICWTAFIIYEIGITAYLAGRFSHIAYYILFYGINILLFYFHSLYILPKAIKGSYSTLWRLPFLLTAECLGYLLLVMLSSQLLDVLHLRKSGPLVFDSRFFAVGLWRWVIFIMYGTGYYFLMSYLSRKKMEMQQAIENEKLKLDLVKSEKDFLRTQINPHLLFNTLNFVKFAAKNRPAEANEAIICLSEIMRFALEQSNTELTSIKSEVDQVKNIILLNQLRFDHTLQIDLKERIENEHLLIIPVVLLTLVENVFKHGNLVEPGYPAEINIEADQRNLIFITRNLADKGSQIQNSCTGIKNILLRLNLCYGEEHSLEYKMEGNIFITKLTIPLKTADH